MKKERPIKRFEAPRGTDKVTNVLEFLKLGNIEITGIHVSRYIPTYRIVGLTNPDIRSGILIKKSELDYITNQYLLDQEAIDSDPTLGVVQQNVDILKEAFAIKENEVFEHTT